MRTLIMLVAFGFGAVLPASVSAQAGRNTSEAITDNVQIHRDRAQLVRDTREVESFQKLVATLDLAISYASKEEAGSISLELRSAMQREVTQAQLKVAQASVEVGQSRREARVERQEARVTGRVVDKLQAVDDGMDLGDDRRDRRSAVSRARNMDALLARSNSLEEAIARGEMESLTQQLEAAKKFLDLMRNDVAATAAELGEDRRERREDRRERRTDRRK